jgi:hypothetical protein
MSMGYTAHHKEFGSLARPAVTKETVTQRSGILKRIFDAFVASRQREVDRQIARFLATRSGGVLTDSVEREISQRLLRSNWSPNSDAFDNRKFP